MKNTIKYIATLLSGALMFASCGASIDEIRGEHVPAVNSTTSKINPYPNSSNTGTRAFVGTEVTCVGYNLDQVGRVTINDVDALITMQDIETLKFQIPALDLPQMDETQQTEWRVYAADGVTCIFNMPYYVNIPIVDVIISSYAPKTGSVGDEITITGRNLEQVTRVHFAGSTVEAADCTFTPEAKATTLKFKVPGGTYAQGNSDVEIKADWSTKQIDVTGIDGQGLFAMKTPKFDVPQPTVDYTNIIGDKITLTGENLDLVTKIKWDTYELTLSDKSATSVTIEFPKTIVEAAPATQTKAITALWGTPEQTTTVAETWALDTTQLPPVASGYTPATGTIGTEITITGVDLHRLTAVTFGTVDVPAASFKSQSETEVKFAVPAGTYTAGNSDIAIKGVYGAKSIDVTTTLFAMKTPKFTTPTQEAGTQSELGDDLTITGQNLDLVTAVKWDTFELVITEKLETSITVKFPSSITEATPAVQTKAITALWGTPEQTATIVSAWKLNTAVPVGVTIPTVTSMTAADGYYLGKEIVIAGTDLTEVSAVQLWYNDGTTDQKTAATIKGTTTYGSLTFTVPEDVTFSTATDVDVHLIYNTTDNVKATADAKVKIYPFYVTKGLRMGTGSNSSSTYPAYNQQNAFLMLDSGSVISADDWWSDSVDSPVKNNTPLVTVANTVAAGTLPAMYYSVKPYVFFSAASPTGASPNKFAINGPANSNGQLKTHCYGTKTALPGLFGTPVIYFRVINDDATLKASIVAGTVESVESYAKLGGSGAPAFATAEGSSAWVEGSVIVIQYINAAKCTGAVGKPAATTDIYKQGYMYIKTVTCADSTTGLANDDRIGYVEFDLYWSKEMNK